MDADQLVDRERLKSTLFKWRLVAVLAVLALVLVYTEVKGYWNKTSDAYIARVSFEGVITEDDKMLEVLEELKNDDAVKAVLVKIDSNGSTAVAGEMVYYKLREIAEKKPVASYLGTTAASGGYMMALASDQIFTQRSSLVGSVGVIFQSFEVTELAHKLGVTPINIKSSELKGSPSPFEKMTPQAKDAMESLVADTYGQFLGLVLKRRNMKEDDEKFFRIAEGRVYTGNQALQLGLVDQIGGKNEAVNWLKEKGKLDKDIDVIDIALFDSQKVIKDIFGTSSFWPKLFGLKSQTSKGLMMMDVNLM